MTINLLRVDGDLADDWWDGPDQIDRLILDGARVYSRVDEPHITRFVVAPAYGVQGAAVTGNAGWDTTGDVATTALEHRLASSSGAWTPIGFPDGTTDSDPFTWPTEDFDVRLRVADRLGEYDQRVVRRYRTLAPDISIWTTNQFHQTASGVVISTWNFELECLCWPKPVVGISGSVAGALHVSQGRLARTSVANGWTGTWQHSVGGQPDTSQIWTVTVANPTTGETDTATLTLGG